MFGSRTNSGSTNCVESEFVRGCTAWALATATVAVVATHTHAAVMLGDFASPTVSYSSVTESSSGAYGTPMLLGDKLIFAPTNMVANASNGEIDITDGVLAMMVESENDIGIETLEFEESGFYTLLDTGGEATRVLAGLAVAINVLEIDGTPVALDPSVTNLSTLIFSADLDDLGETFLDSWNGLVSFDLATAAQQQLGINGEITKINITIDNQLIAASEANSAAFIDKKVFEFGVTLIPEPASAVLAGLGLAVIAVRRRSS